MRTVVHLLRHGEVDNPDGILYGRLPDFHLSGAGREMAGKVAAYLAGADVVHVVSSPLDRAQETAAPLAEAFALPVHSDGRLIEAANAFEGSRFAVGDGALRRPANWWRLRNPFRPSWGEPYVGIARRMLGAIADARDTAAGHEAVLVSHQLPIWTIRRLVEHRRLWHDPRHRQCGLASLTSLTYEDHRLVAVGYIEPAGPTGPTVPGA
ncbi:MAG: histidine phosphatase family protein [Actinobacteria bacterium]|nr:histidine phosphatase family protein [Actinomycetota bacterium]MBI3685979.1 histidine phosphatase family protein [Actinomycetota bacterium]